MQFLMDMLDFKQHITARKILHKSYHHSKTFTMIRQQPPNFNKVSFISFYIISNKIQISKFFCNCSLKNFGINIFILFFWFCLIFCNSWILFSKVDNLIEEKLRNIKQISDHKFFISYSLPRARSWISEHCWAISH